MIVDREWTALAEVSSGTSVGRVDFWYLCPILSLWDSVRPSNAATSETDPRNPSELALLASDIVSSSETLLGKAS
jgi:hypothetical protein